MPSQAENPRAPKGTMAMATIEMAVAVRSCELIPMASATTLHNGATSVHRTMFLAYRSRLNMIGSFRAETMRRASEPNTFVAGTSENIQPANTIANAKVPCSANNAFFQWGGNKNHNPVMRTPLTATTIGAS